LEARRPRRPTPRCGTRDPRRDRRPCPGSHHRTGPHHDCLPRTRRKEITMSRVQLASNVDDLDEAITFYSKLFNPQPAKVKPGYANFAITQPPLKLVLL